MSVEELRLLQRAARKGRHDLVASLIMNGADINAGDSHGRTAAHEAARNGHVHVLEVLHALGCDLNRCSTRGVSVAHQAAYGGHVPFLHRLVACGGRVDLVDGNDRTPLEVAIDAQQWPAVAFLEKIYSEQIIEDDPPSLDSDLHALLPPPAPFDNDLLRMLHSDEASTTDATDVLAATDELDGASERLQALLPANMTKKRKREGAAPPPTKRIFGDDGFMLPSTPMDQQTRLQFNYRCPPVSSPERSKQMPVSAPWRRKHELWMNDDASTLLHASVADLLPMEPPANLTLPTDDADISVHALLENFDS
ncbi:hypothetical protein ACHHYP_01882 [Achlya hypogyna]|uniref:Uncharacterized protein n=1 Tax=Achlya hypogyna TaxID=1202772 RepID=A0A1V9ZSP7_ACHHY|nr:hypothetical protein ACHHYP_01882 [Achlya hypogyna]